MYGFINYCKFQVPQEKTSNTEDGEEQLDFEAEEGECIEPKTVEQSNGDAEDKTIDRGNQPCNREYAYIFYLS